MEGAASKGGDGAASKGGDGAASTGGDEDIDRKCRDVFRTFVVKEHAGSRKLSEAEKKLGKTTTVKKLILGPMGEKQNVVSLCDACVFPKLRDKTTMKISDVIFVGTLLKELATEKKRDAVSKKVKGAADWSIEAMVTEWKDKIAKAHGATEETTKNAAVVDRLTDAKGYTGSHKERFDESGKGKGKEGRADFVDNTGYVGQYKGQGTHGTKK